MRKWIFAAVILGCLVLVAGALVVWVTTSFRGAVTGAGGMPVGESYVQFLHFGGDSRIGLVIWSDMDGTRGSTGESGLFQSNYQGFASSPDGRRIDWEWKSSDKKGGAFQINGTAYDLGQGKLFLVSTKGGPVRVTQVNVNLANVTPDPQRFAALAKSEPKIAEFIAESKAQK
jgi:hypothetical protein